MTGLASHTREVLILDARRSRAADFTELNVQHA